MTDGPVEIDLYDMAHGGEAVGRHHGKTVFVGGAIPGERVRASIVREKAAWARADLEEVLASAPTRVAPPCPHFLECGGCQWQYMAYIEQLKWKSSIVAGQLRHLGGASDPEIAPIVAPSAPFGYRNRMTFHVEDGRPGLYRLRSKQQIPISACLLLVPGLADLYQRLGPLPGVKEVTLRMGVTTGERAVLIRGRTPELATGWGASVIRLTGRRFEPLIGPPRVHEEVAGVHFRITGPAFFQVNTEGAGALAKLVDNALQPSGSDTMLDAYAGVGLFAATVGKSAGRVVAVESSGIALADLRHNLSEAGVSNHEVVRGRFEEVAGEGSWDLAVCDPPRSGLGERGVTALVAGKPRRIAYVSCDPASLARDTRLFDAAGYRLVKATPVDLFPETFHVETVAEFGLP
ncbi:MAG: class I SAM-dependent RNA methyltransferase [Acidimicrobiia bacterium]|nr:class I SAM-dependent RNA methyltransferase [Acidimicrobiia bacterium]MDH3396646.1 class I SAM-dependent RNA methyltransferase [Acidimicrobiia bacterium]MDH5615174.1 class I SAM-dependent RNA methyltransferase [Acidimicrobiia bacterium]